MINLIARCIIDYFKLVITATINYFSNKLLICWILLLFNS